MKKQIFKLVFVGHVDHGKSSLIGRTLYETASLPKETYEEVKRVSLELGKDAELAFLTDYLQEERERNITIDTTQIFFKTRKHDFVIIDAPGHVQFIKNMLSGASQAELAVLLVDAGEGIKEQTRRHAYLVHLLGIKNLIVVVNKMDLVNYEQGHFHDIRKEIIDFLQQLSIVPINVIPVSAALGENVSKESAKMSWYDGPFFTDCLDSLKPVNRKASAPFRLPVQDVLVRKNSNIVLGRVESGSVERNQQLLILPDGKTTRVLDVLRYGERRKVALTGESIGLVLENDNGIERGNVLVQQEKLPAVSDRLHATIFWMYNDILRTGDDLVLQCSTQSIPCCMESIEKRIDSSTLDVLERNGTGINTNEVGEVTFRLNKPIVFELFSNIPELGRLVLRKNENVCGAGIVNKL